MKMDIEEFTKWNWELYCAGRSTQPGLSQDGQCLLERLHGFPRNTHREDFEAEQRYSGRCQLCKSTRFNYIKSHMAIGIHHADNAQFYQWLLGLKDRPGEYGIPVEYFRDVATVFDSFLVDQTA